MKDESQGGNLEPQVSIEKLRLFFISKQYLPLYTVHIRLHTNFGAINYLSLVFL
jgi:hypothetical protein